MRKRTQRAGLLVAGAVSAAMLTGAAGVVAQDQVEFDVYDLHTQNPGLAFLRMAADAFQGTHPNVKINITTLENEALKDKIAADMQAGSPPDMFQ